MKKLKLKITNYFLNNKLFLAYVILSLISCTLLRAFTVGGILSLKPFLADLALILMIGSFSYLVKVGRRYVYLMSWLIVYTFINVANGIYYTFYYSFTTFGYCHL